MAEPLEPAASTAAGSPEMPAATRAENVAENSVAVPGDTGKPSATVSRTEGGEVAWSELSSPGAEKPPLQESPPVAWPRLARVDYSIAPDAPPVSSKSDGNPYRLWMWVAAQVCGLGLLLGGYFLGQAWAPRTRTAKARTEAPAVIEPGFKHQQADGERALDAANRALKAERRHDFQTARAIYEEMAKRQTPLVGAEYRLAVISVHEEDVLQTETHLNRSLLAREMVGDCYLFKASLAGIKSNFADASLQLAAAVRAQPFSAKLLFCWGEALRRDGRPSEAVQHLADALDRPDDPAARDLYAFKLRMAKLESGNDAIFNAELARRLSDPTASGDWLLLAAAQEIGRKNPFAALRLLEKAQALLPPEVFRTYLQDYIFQTQRTQPELARVLNVPPPAISATIDGPLEDPAVWTAAVADPATWPPFPTTE